MEILLIGGSGVIGLAVARACLDRGHGVAVVSRGRTLSDGPEGIEWLVADRTDRNRFREAVKGRRFDAVVDMISFDAEDAERTLSLFDPTRTKFLFISSVAAYERPLASLPSREESESLRENPAFAYGFGKAEMERHLRRRSEEGYRITIARPSLTFGPGARNFGVLRQNYGVVHRIRSRKPLVLFGDGTVPWSFTFVPDMAEAIAALLESEESIGQACHIAGDEWTDWRGLYRTVGRIVGEEPIFEYLPARALWEADPVAFGHIWYEKSYPGLFDTSLLRRLAPGFRPRIGRIEGMRSVIDSWDADGAGIDPALDRMEDRLAEAARKVRRDLRSPFSDAGN